MTGINITQLKYDIVEPAIAALGLMSTSALNLVTGTALVESNASLVVQLGGGPALGLWQVEPVTEQDMWSNYLAYQRELSARVRAMLAPGDTTKQLVWNLQYGAAVCRIKYLREKPPLPSAKDADALAAKVLKMKLWDDDNGGRVG